jgi:pyrimidine-specific ribonucleoside hydrolase
MNIIFDMETSDPDDAITLCWLLSRPDVNLRAITITPGSHAQVGLVQHIIKMFGKEIPIGAEKPEHPKDCVSAFHYNWLGKIGPGYSNGPGGDIIAAMLKQWPDSVVLTGGPLGNIKQAIEEYKIELDTIVMQGGFAGDNVVAPEDRLEKFAGKTTCPTFNFNGNPSAANLALSYEGFRKRYLVSKNVCHSVLYDKELHKQFRGHPVIRELMDVYLERHPTGKLLHDPLAACCAVNRNICSFKEVEMYRERGEWGCHEKPGSNTFISVKVDKEKFYNFFSQPVVPRNGERIDNIE